MSFRSARFADMSWSELTNFPTTMEVDNPIPEPAPTLGGIPSGWHAGGGGSREVLDGFRDESSFDQVASAEVQTQWNVDHPSYIKYLPWIGGGLLLLLVLTK